MKPLFVATSSSGVVSPAFRMLSGSLRPPRRIQVRVLKKVISLARMRFTASNTRSGGAATLMV